MGLEQIENPAGAFSSAGQDNVQTFSNVNLTVPCSAAIAVGQLVALASDDNGYVTAAPGAVTTNTATVGVALNSTVNPGDLVTICILGIADVLTDTTDFTAGDAFTVSAGGVATAALEAGVIGANQGIILEANASKAVLVAAFISFQYVPDQAAT